MNKNYKLKLSKNETLLILLTLSIFLILFVAIASYYKDIAENNICVPKVVGVMLPITNGDHLAIVTLDTKDPFQAQLLKEITIVMNNRSFGK